MDVVRGRPEIVEGVVPVLGIVGAAFLVGHVARARPLEVGLVGRRLPREIGQFSAQQQLVPEGLGDLGGVGVVGVGPVELVDGDNGRAEVDVLGHAVRVGVGKFRRGLVPLEADLAVHVGAVIPVGDRPGVALRLGIDDGPGSEKPEMILEDGSAERGAVVISPVGARPSGVAQVDDIRIGARGRLGAHVGRKLLLG